MNIAQDVPREYIKAIHLAAINARNIEHPVTSANNKAELRDKVKQLLKERDAVLVSHYYVEDDLQDLAEETGGMVADSLEMARFAFEHPAKRVIVAGVKFMGETSKILSPKKHVHLVEPQAECSLDMGCPVKEFSEFCDQYPDRTVVVYANTSAAVKARADWVVTSSIALPIVKYLHKKGKKILWGPDRYLGSYIQQETGADMLMWQGSCIIHEEFKAAQLKEMKKENPHAAVLVHPESPAGVIDLADVVGSTSRLLNASRGMDNEMFIVATEVGIFHKMQQYSPQKKFIAAPTAGEGATCSSCAQCPWMKMNDLQRLHDVLAHGYNEITIDEAIRVEAEKSLQRMVNFAREHINPTMKVTGNA